jgi:DNA-binding response OmpR family regulator
VLFRPDGAPCRLSTAEFEVLRLLVAEPGRPVAREALHQATFGRPLRAGDRAVDSVVYKLRRKIGEDLGEHEVIKGVRQVGYVFTGFPA